MKLNVSAAALWLTIVAAAVCAASLAEQNKKEIVGITADEVRWFTPAYYNDGRQRAHLLGDSSKGGEWIDRLKIPAGARVLAHTHPQDEPVTVIEGRSTTVRRPQMAGVPPAHVSFPDPTTAVPAT